jgi:hypothetical protein
MGMNILEGSSIQILIVLSTNASDLVLDFISHASNSASTFRAG